MKPVRPFPRTPPPAAPPDSPFPSAERNPAAPAEAEALDRVLREAGGDVMRETARARDPWRASLGRAVGALSRPRRTGARHRPRAASLHSYHPFLFHAAFPEVPGHTVRELAVADRMYTEHLLDCDRTLDRPGDPYPGFLFLSQLEQVDSLKRLYRLFPPESPFWPYFFRCHRETWQAVRQEWLWQVHRVSSISLARFLALARGKSSLLKPCTMALAFLSRREGEQAWISRVLDHHHAGLLFLDDLEDWKEDFLRGNYTFLLTRVFFRAGLEKELTRGNGISLRRVGSALYGSGEAERQLRWAEGCFRKATRVPPDADVPLWKALNERHAKRCIRARARVNEYRMRKHAGRRTAGTEKACRPEPETGAIRIILHPGVPRHLAGYASRIAQRCGERLPAPMPRELFLGHWADMPAYFHCLDDLGTSCAVNLRYPVHPPLISTTGIPLRVEIVTSLLAAGRHREHGPVETLLEILMLGGLGVWICSRLWPDKPLRKLTGISRMEWEWIRKHERYLWERVEPRVMKPLPPGQTFPGIHRPPARPGLGFPSGVLLFLGFCFLAHIQARNVSPDPVQALLRMHGAVLHRELKRYLYH